MGLRVFTLIGLETIAYTTALLVPKIGEGIVIHRTEHRCAMSISAAKQQSRAPAKRARRRSNPGLPRSARVDRSIPPGWSFWEYEDGAYHLKPTALGRLGF